ncbi:Mbr1p NDAI_0K02180 [Naumovozyma dairenensis CBS 421]|uniref:Uncharacterized protein n=1 Tax=Naumovozyma dairenensis (strain ATCC 10597 / BCRC 20456 / CBS 421 / NBRC 0211 / NRRL Y-12639) TaxID=1071378 RepID=G0WHZ8_NAUDC|nr:hypothetical protein NDAI_0K02180 [Naumovozyma dairenensis CBS 421]CCD27409.1 hypothetical protein NDAI_0K02180 [Naumovozyma dairenensis CBS 421]
MENTSVNTKPFKEFGKNNEIEKIKIKATGKPKLKSRCSSNILCLNLFERAVQDPYCSGCDIEDDEASLASMLDTSDEELPDQNYILLSPSEQKWYQYGQITDENSDIGEVDPLDRQTPILEPIKDYDTLDDVFSYSFKSNTPTHPNTNRRVTMTSTCDFQKNNDGYIDSSPESPRNLRKVKTVPFPPNSQNYEKNITNFQILRSSPFLLRNSRRNSSDLIRSLSDNPSRQQSSIQSTRSSILNIPSTFSSNLNTTTINNSNNINSNDINNNSRYGRTSTKNSGFDIAASPIQRRYRPRFSPDCYSSRIPSHLYCLENHISSNLDALSSSSKQKYLCSPHRSISHDLKATLANLQSETRSSEEPIDNKLTPYNGTTTVKPCATSHLNSTTD